MVQSNIPAFYSIAAVSVKVNNYQAVSTIFIFFLNIVFKI